MISIYVIQIILILFFGFLFRNDKKKFLLAAFIVLFVVMAFRHAEKIGVDSATSYYNAYTNIEKEIIKWPNPGLQMIMKLLHSVNADYQWVIVITAAWVCFAYYRLLVKYSENGFISVMWFLGMLFYSFLFSALKQAWAMAFLCFAFDAVFKRKPIRFLLFVGLAVIFHFPALIFLPAYFVARLRINKSFPILMFSILVVVFVFRQQILNLMVSSYENHEGDYSSDAQFLGTKFIFMGLMLAYGFYQYLSNNNPAIHKRTIFPSLLYYMGIAAVIQTFCFYSNNFERLADYYYQFSILFVPLMLSGEAHALNSIGGTDSMSVNDSPNLSISFEKKRITNYSANDISINTVLSFIITVFCVWRYISTLLNDPFYSPFFFFWQG